MKILIINGSPRGNQGNTAHLLASFMEGVKETCDVNVREIIVAEKNIAPCMGCFSCWVGDCGKCCMDDDMTQIIDDIVWADAVIWSFPLYYFNVPGPVKTLIDRTLPMLHPYMVDDSNVQGSGAHSFRYDLTSKKYVLISTCGFYSAEGNYDGVESLFDHMYGKGNYETVFTGEGALFSIPQLAYLTDGYLANVRKAGSEFIRGKITDKTGEALKELMIPREQYEEMCNSGWGERS